ncbi:Hypothetical predicted protein [Prunus dulcis]|uniref:Uncharacterized protein n=1 Tax=Prunus dulcis TaxID=3755 RepID=A0A5E4GPV1_PRUDU|nr:Hypothetical predicted protein [Prunus dulcis]
MAVDWESEELSEDEEGQLEVIRALPPSALDAAEVLSSSSLRKSGLLDPIPEPMGVDRNDPKARQLLERLLKKGTIASVSGRTVPPKTHARNEVVALVVTVGQVEALFSHYGMVRRFMIHREKEVRKCNA